MSGSAAGAMRSFFVDIAYRVSRDSENHFLNSIEHATKEVAELYAAVESAAGGILAFTMKIAAGMERMYYASQRTGSGVQAMNAFSYAISQVGGTAAGAQQSLEGIAAFLRSTPAGEGFFHGLGIATRDANNQFIGTEKIAEQFAKRMAAMPQAQAQAYANVVGIDQQTLLAMRNNFGPYMAEYDDMVKKAGLNSQQAAKDGVEFTRSVRSLGSAFSVLELKIASTLESKLGGQIRHFRDIVVANFGNIADVIEKGAKVLLDLAAILGVIATRAVTAIRTIVEWFNQLNPATRRMVEGIGLLVAGWYLLNKTFLASPIGFVIALGAAILALIDDYNTWKKGGTSLIDWTKWEPAIAALLAAINIVGRWMGDLAGHTQAVQIVLEAFGIFIAGRWLWNMRKGFGGAAAAAGGLGGALGKLSLMYAAWEAGQTVGNYLANIDEHPPSWLQKARHWLGTDDQAEDHPVVDTLMRWMGIGSPKPATSAATATLKAGGYGSAVSVAPGTMGIMNMLMKMGPWSLQQAAGIAANVQEESGNNYQEWGDNGKSYGLYQASKDRRDLIEAHFDQVRGSHKAYTDYSAQEQLQGLNWEMLEGNERRGGSAILQEPTSAGAARDMSVMVERSADPNKVGGIGDFTRRRVDLAPLAEQHYYALHPPGGATGTASSGGSPVSVNTNTTIHVQAPPGNDPHSFANVIAKLNDQQNQTTLRNVANKTQ